MKKSMMSKILSLLLALIMILFLVVSVRASAFDTVVDDNRLGSITVTLRDQKDKTLIEGAEITIYKIADTKVTNNNLGFTFTQELKKCGLKVKDYYKVEFAEEIASYIEENKISGEMLETNEFGVAKFPDLTHGIYLVMQTYDVAGYSRFTPFVAVLPITKDNQWVYDVSANPKMAVVSYTDITVKKVWFDDNGAGATKRPESVKIRLLQGDDVIDSVVLSEENGWQHTWVNMVERDDYSVEEVKVPKDYKATYKQNGFEFTVTNTATLVQTGQLNWPIPILAFSGLVLIALGYILRNRGKRYE